MKARRTARNRQLALLLLALAAVAPGCDPGGGGSTLGGTLAGLAPGAVVVLQLERGPGLGLTEDGPFTFPGRFHPGDSYAVSVFAQPAFPSQTCVVSRGSGIVGQGDVLDVDVSCSTDRFPVGGSLSGLAPGAALVLQDNGADDLTLTQDGPFSFPTPLLDLSPYSVTVLTQPTHPDQRCAVSRSQGVVAGGAVVGLEVTCQTSRYGLGGMVFGLAPGGRVVLRSNRGEELAVGANRPFEFLEDFEDLSAYAVSVLEQPSAPDQRCEVANGSGAFDGADVADVEVRCSTLRYAVGGTLTGLAPGNEVVLQNNLQDVLTLAADGAFAFGGLLPDGSDYAVTVLTQPSAPDQTCLVTNGQGSLQGGDATGVEVVCSADLFTVGGSLAGLAPGNEVVLQNNLGDDLVLSADGPFVFATPLPDLGPFSVSVLVQPTSPNQLCTVESGQGSLDGAPYDAAVVTCATIPYSIGGTLAGLTPGNEVVLQNNLGDDLILAADGPFTFPAALADGSDYSVTVRTQPSSPNQICTVARGGGTLAGVDVLDVAVTCATEAYTVGGDLSGLALGNEITLQNNLGDDLILTEDGPFTFPAALADGSDYSVTVLTQPTSPNQTCTVIRGTGTLSGMDVEDVAVICATEVYRVGGDLTGLEPGNEVVLQNNLGDDLILTEDGPFTFPAALADGSDYSVTVLTQPTSPSQTCTVTRGEGALAGADVEDVAVDCALDLFTVGGTVTGLEAGNWLVLQNNGGDDLVVDADGAFTFPTGLPEGATYEVLVADQGLSPHQVCILANGSGGIELAPITTIVLSCSTPPRPTLAVGDLHACALDDQGQASCWGLMPRSGLPFVAAGLTFSSIAAADRPTSQEDFNYLCGLRSDGSLYCCCPTDEEDNPPPGTNFVKVSGNSIHSACALEDDGSIHCWSPSAGPTLEPQGKEFIDLSRGDRISCALRSDGSILCLGSQGEGPPPGPGFSQITAGYEHACAMAADGSLACWGSGGAGTIAPPTGNDWVEVAAGAFNTCARNARGGITCWGSDQNGINQTPTGDGFTSIAVGTLSACASRGDRSITCWGANAGGEATAPTGARFAMVNYHYRSVCGVRTDGTAACWGDRVRFNHMEAPPRSDYAAVAAGLAHACALHLDGSISCWGTDYFGCAQAPPGTDFVAIEAGDGHSCALRQDGTIHCWGSDDSGESSAPAFSDFTSIAAGSGHNCALRQDGTATCWGGPAGAPIVAPGDSDFVSVTSGIGGSCALHQEGSISCWGFMPYHPPVEPGFASISMNWIESDVACNWESNCALRQDGSVICWSQGTGCPYVLLEPDPAMRFESISTPCGILEDGAMYCWGPLNSYNPG
ncbi:MAG TPA: hypothetical protein PK668_12130 [Myxococcota bacterium]|nr:hypothetical protein [Myxococcota bacterium]